MTYMHTRSILYSTLFSIDDHMSSGTGIKIWIWIWIKVEIKICEQREIVRTTAWRTLTRLSPMWPAMCRPGRTREGVALEPMEPCCRWDLDP